MDFYFLTQMIINLWLTYANRVTHFVFQKQPEDAATRLNEHTTELLSVNSVEDTVLDSAGETSTTAKGNIRGDEQEAALVSGWGYLGINQLE